MGNISVRLPEEVEAVLEHEAHLSHRTRSELVREAITEYVARRERQRFLEEIVAAARTLAADAHARGEALGIAESAVGDGLDRDEDPRGDQTSGSAERWWR
jgi:predicted transcriptional regulator